MGANGSHGLRRNRQDIRRAIDLLLRDEEWGKWSDREIARRVGCHHTTVGTVRDDLALSGEISQIENRTVSRNGTTYTQAERQTAALDGVNRNEQELSGEFPQIDERNDTTGDDTVPPAGPANVPSTPRCAGSP